MKKLFLIIFVLVSTFAKAQNQLDSLHEIDGKVIYQSIVDVPGKSQGFIFAAVHKWTFDYYTSTRSFTEDKDQGQIIGKPIFNINDDNYVVYTYSLQITCKDNKYRIQVYDISYTFSDGLHPTYSLESFNDDLKKTKNKSQHRTAYQIDAFIKSLMSSLSNAVTKAAKDDF